MELGWPWSHSSLTIRPGRTRGMGGAGAIPCTARGSSVIRMRQGTVPRGTSPRGTGLALAFRTLLSFQGTSPGCSSATHSRFPCHVPSPERRGRYHGPLEIVKDFPPVRSVLLAESCSPRRRRHTEAPPRTRTVWASGRPPKAVGWTPVAFGDLLSSVAGAARRRPGEVLGPEELPCLQLGDGSTGRDGVSTNGRQQRQRFQRPGQLSRSTGPGLHGR
jgi:hypothetical protein